eukprot:gene6971-11137_t
MESEELFNLFFAQLSELENLEELYFEEHDFTEHEIHILLKFLQKKSLLLLSFEIVEWTEKLLKIFLEKLTKIDSLKGIRFNIFPDTGVSILCKYLEKTNELEMLHLDRVDLTESSFQLVSNSLSKNKSLKKFEFFNLNLNSSGMIQSIQDHMNLESLSLVRTKKIGKAIGNFLQVNSHLKSLSIAKSEISNDDVRIISEVLLEKNTLTYLSLSRNLISENGAFFLAIAIVTNTTLEHLAIENNNIGSIGMKHLLNSLEINESLRILDVSRNNISDDGIKEFNKFNGLKSFKLNNNNIKNGKLVSKFISNSSLKTLHISHNMIEGDVKHIMDILESNKNLTTLDVACNQITNESSASIGNMLSKNKTLQFLNLSGNYIKEFEYIAIGIGKNTQLKQLILRGNLIKNQNIPEFYIHAQWNYSLQLLSINHQFDKKLVWFVERNKRYEDSKMNRFKNIWEITELENLNFLFNDIFELSS